MLGLKRGTVKLVEYNPKWKQGFSREAETIRDVLEQDCIDIQHVGSTAIPDILAKPIIDIAVVVPTLEKAEFYQEKLREIGYDLKENDTRAERLFFTKGPENNRTHYLHLGELKGVYVQDMILFRDYLCRYKNFAEDYVSLKKDLTERYRDRRYDYTAGKESFVKRVIKLARESKLIDFHEKR
ncbi:MAG: GrpB family protein [Candidatus Moraniibacteriota bacterium]|nr:MAG: GrpB family protein [Candidatus Moranbacteria bacterium]